MVSEHGAAAWCDPERWLPEALTAASRRASGLPDQQPAVGAVRPDRRGVRRGTARARPARCLQGALAGRRSRVPPSHGDWVRLLRRFGFVVEALHEIYAPTDPATTRSTRSCRPNGQLAGQPRSCGWPHVRFRVTPEAGPRPPISPMQAAFAGRRGRPRRPGSPRRQASLPARNGRPRPDESPSRLCAACRCCRQRYVPPLHQAVGEHTQRRAGGISTAMR